MERSGKQLIDATRPFAVEEVAKTWTQTALTFGGLGLCLVAASGALAPWMPLRIFASVMAGIFIVRGFIVYHDAMHGAVFRGRSLQARAGRVLMRVYGVLVLTPPNTWRQTHNYHHAHTAKIVGSHVGSYPVMTVQMYRNATPVQRFMYRAVRNPITMLFGYATIFIYGMCVHPFLRNPRKNWDSALALVLHIAFAALMIRALPFVDYALLSLVPLMVAFALGSYLFYAQHNFPGIVLQPRDQWEYTRAALHSSSYLHHGKLVSWLTGNIGYHHVHHVNAAIPFYRLPAAMATIPELQHPHETSLWPRDVMACLRLALWDPDAQRMVGYESLGPRT